MKSNKISQLIDNLELKMNNAVSNMKDMIKKTIQILARFNAATKLGFPTI